ncbi:glycerophosphodiester phosphodiesterase [Streptomyces bathyalis]|uniref:Glycerophosphodiester phosphodiesterase n=1 Tax=Streptomyces bathyalis TaxID=2710756 RepID=A0A7T1TBK4_9ACTN|nr:glycerophosphodiester phosphodiesterase family protein [Streptomyces bathyalis]QPP09976.1 glycerophosphodiester phosphodiesterase [Streptomyces bathyalis]
MSLLIVGHRGVMGVEPENTLRSFVRAEHEGVDVIELDLHLSKDGELVVMHDADVSRTTDGSGAISDFTLAQLRELDAGQGERIPTFHEVVEAVGSPLQAEIKDRAAARVLTGVIDELGLHERVTVISFHDEALREVREHLPEMPLVLVTGRSTPTAPERARELGAFMVSCELQWLESETVERCHADGIKVITWTVNTGEELDRVRELGLDGLVTDMPEIKTAARRAS